MKPNAKGDFQRADLIALAATKAAFARWCHDRLVSLTEQYTELFREKAEEVEIALRAIKRCPEIYSENEKLSWTQRHEKINNQLFSLAYEVGLLLFVDSFSPTLLRRWREEQQKTILRGEVGW